MFSFVRDLCVGRPLLSYLLSCFYIKRPSLHKQFDPSKAEAEERRKQASIRHVKVKQQHVVLSAPDDPAGCCSSPLLAAAADSSCQGAVP